MTVQEQVMLAPFTTFRIGGPADVFIEATTGEDVDRALAYARERALPVSVLGGGSNILVPDAGVPGMVLKIALTGITQHEEGDSVLVVAGAGETWDTLVEAASARELWGIENLAGIPGTVGGAAVQNIGAYGAELKTVYRYAEVIDATSGEKKRIRGEDAAFGYRMSIFKTHPELVVLRVAVRLTRRATPNLRYADLARAKDEGQPLATPKEIAKAVRAIRATKFPYETEGGSAGSFFKNPVVSAEQGARLAARFPGLPLFPQPDGAVKMSLAWFLDHVLSLKGCAVGRVRLYEKQPMVVIAEPGATAREVDTLAALVTRRVDEASGIRIEREVETFGTR